MATHNPYLGHPLSPLAGAHLPPRPTPASRRVAEIYPSPASNVSLTYSTSDDDHHAHDDGDVDARSATSSSNDNSYNTNTSTSPVLHVIGADPWGLGSNEQARTGGSDGEEKEECASADSSYEEGFTQVLEGIDMGVDSINSGLGMGTVIGKRVGDGGQEVITVGSTLALVSSAQAAVREQMDSLQRQDVILVEAKAAITTLAGRLATSEAEKDRLMFANDELTATLMAMEEEKVAQTNNRENSRQIVELTHRADSAETAKFDVLRENELLAATVAEARRNNDDMCKEIALLKATLAKRGDAEAFKFKDRSKATPSPTSYAATAKATSTAPAETPRSATRRPLTAVDPNSERKSGNRGESLASLADPTASRDFPMKRSPVVKPVVSLVAASVRRTAAVSPSTAGNMSSVTLSKAESPVQQTAPTTRRYSARIAAKAGRDAPHPPRRFSARIAANASRDSIATGRGGVATRGSKRVEDESPLSSLRVTRSTFRAAEKAATAADSRLTAEPKVKDRKRFMRF